MNETSVNNCPKCGAPYELTLKNEGESVVCSVPRECPWCGFALGAYVTEEVERLGRQLAKMGCMSFQLTDEQVAKVKEAIAREGRRMA